MLRFFQSSPGKATHSQVVYLDMHLAPRGGSGPNELAGFDPALVVTPAHIGSRSLSNGLRRTVTSSEDWLSVLTYLKRRHSLEKFTLCLGVGLAPVFSIDVGESVLQPGEVETFATFQASRLLGDRLAGFELSMELAATPQRCVTAIPKGLLQAVDSMRGNLIDRATRRPQLSTVTLLSYVLDHVAEIASESWLLALVTPGSVQMVHRGQRGFRIFAPRDPGVGSENTLQAIAQAEAAIGAAAGLPRWLIRLDCLGPGQLPGWRVLDLSKYLWPKVI